MLGLDGVSPYLGDGSSVASPHRENRDVHGNHNNHKNHRGIYLSVIQFFNFFPRRAAWNPVNGKVSRADGGKSFLFWVSGFEFGMVVIP